MEVPEHAQAVNTPIPRAGDPTIEEAERKVADIEHENRVLSDQLTTLHETLRHERAEAAKVSATLEQLSRALPPPAADTAEPARERRPWWRRVVGR